MLCTPSASASSADEPEIVALSGWAIRLPLSLDHSKRTWRDLICQAWPSDPLPCPKGQNEMRLIALIEEPLVIEKILRHLSLWCGLKKIRRSPITPRRSGVQPTTHRRRISDRGTKQARLRKRHHRLSTSNWCNAIRYPKTAIQSPKMTNPSHKTSPRRRTKHPENLQALKR